MLWEQHLSSSSASASGDQSASPLEARGRCAVCCSAEVVEGQMEGVAREARQPHRGLGKQSFAHFRQKGTQGCVRWPGSSQVRDGRGAGPSQNAAFQVGQEVPLPCLCSHEVSTLPYADAQKFKTKFEECRKETEEREKKGTECPMGGGFLADSLCAQLQPQPGVFSVCHRIIPGCCDHLAVSRVMQPPRDTALAGELAASARAHAQQRCLMALGLVVESRCPVRTPRGRRGFEWSLWSPAYLGPDDGCHSKRLDVTEQPDQGPRHKCVFAWVTPEAGWPA